MPRIADLKYNLSFSVSGTEELQRAQTIAQSIAMDQRLLAEETKKAGVQTKGQTQAVRDGNTSLKTYLDSLYRLRNGTEQGSRAYKAITAEITRFTHVMRTSDETTKRYNSTLIANQAREAARVAKMKDATTSAELLRAKSAALISSMGQETSISARTSMEYEKLNREYNKTIANLTRLTNMVGITRTQKARLVKEVNVVKNDQARLNSTLSAAGHIYRGVSSSLEEVSADLRLLDANVRANRTNTDQATEEWQRLVAALDLAEGTLLGLGKSAGLSSSQLSELKGELARVRQQATQTSRDINGVSSAFTGTTKATNSANQLMLSFGDIAQDSAQFSFGFAQGMRAIGNNITFAAEQYTILAQKAAIATGRNQGLANSMAFLLSSLRGPMGLILALNAVVTIITVMSTRQQRLGKETDKSASSMGELADTTRSFINEYARLRDVTSYDPLDVRSMQRQADAMQVLIERSSGLEQATKRVAEEKYRVDYIINRLFKSFGQINGTVYAWRETLNATAKSIQSGWAGAGGVSGILQGMFFILESGVRVAEHDLKVLQDRLGLTAEEAKEVAEGLREVNKQIRISEALLKADPLAVFKRSMTDITDKAIFDFNVGVEGSSQKLLEQKDTLNKYIEAHKKAYRSGAEGARGYIEVLQDLKDKVEKALETTSVETSIKDRLNGAVRQILDSDLVERLKKEPILELELRIKQTNVDTEAGIRQVRDLMMQQLELEMSTTIMSEAEIALKKFEINKQYEESLYDLRKRYADKHDEINNQSLQMQLQLNREIASANMQINNQLITSVGNMFASMIPSRRKGALLMLAIEKGLAIGGVIAQSQERINEVRAEQAKLVALGTAGGFVGNPLAGRYFSAAASMEGSIGAIKASRNKSIAKIAAIGLLQGIAGAGGDSGGGGGGGGRGGAGGGGAEETFGMRETRVEGSQVFRTPGYVPTAPDANAQIFITNELKASRRELFILTHLGEEEYNSTVS